MFFVFIGDELASQVTTQTFNCTGASQSFVVPPCVTSITVEAWGAGGGGGGTDTYLGSPGGAGAYSTSVLTVTSGQVLTVITGCAGAPGSPCAGSAPGGPGGYGLGIGGLGGSAGASGCSGGGGGGGGGSGILNGVIPLIVAGGGGGGGGNFGGGADGGGGGQNGSSSSAPGGILGASGTTDGVGGATTSGDGAGAGGGGGGFNGGGGGSVPGTDNGGAGGGGSLGTTIIIANGQTPGNSGSPNLCARCAIGGNGTAAGADGELIITYTGGFPPTVTANATATVVCSGTPVTLTGGGATSYTWTGGVTDGVAFSPGTTTTYTVTGSNGVCTNTETITVTVNTSPVINVNSASYCVTGSATLTAVGANTYVWSPGTGLSSTNGTSVTANPITTTVYTITGTDVNTCTSTATSTVTVNPLPNVTVTSGTICVGNSITITANGAVTYTWIPGTGLSATTGSNVTAGPLTTTSYTIGGIDANGCANIATTTVTVNPLPIPIAGSNSPVCVNQTLNITGSGGATYTWSCTNGFSSTTQNPVLTPATTNMSGTYTLTVTDINNCVNTATTVVTVNPLPIVAVNSATICVGQQTATLTANGANTYAWSPATGLSATSGAVVNANPNITTVYTITGTDANTCTSTATSTVTVNPLPNVTVNSATICLGQQTATLTANGATTYTWIPGTGLSATTGNSVIANPATTTSYTIGGVDINGCANMATSTVTVNPLPIAVAGSNSPVCVNQTLNITGSGGTTYSWSCANGFSSATQNSVLTPATTNMSGTYTLVVTDFNNCVGIATTVVTVNPLPTVTVNSATICAGFSTTLTTGGANTYSWSPAIGLSATSGASVTANPLITTVYTITGIDVNTCTSTATSTVTVNNSPVVTVNSATLCIGNSATLTANGAATYSWAPSTGLSATLGASITANPVTTTVYSVTGISLTNCSSTVSSTVIVNPLPIVTVNSAIICEGSPATLNALGANTYAWSPGTGLSSSSGASVSANPSVSSNYVVTGTDINNCVNTASCSVTVNPLPNVIASPPTTSGCVPLCVSFNNAGTSTGTCVWNFGDGGTDNSSCTPFHCFTMAGTYSVNLQLTDINGCVNNSSANVIAYPVPVANYNASPQPTTILDPIIYFMDVSSGANIVVWSWIFGDYAGVSTTQNPQYVYQDTGTYLAQLVVVSDFGCKDSISRYIFIDDEYMIFVPNAFTPNFDGTNDIFMPKGQGITEYKLYIYDRWGVQIFFSDDLYKGWDGTRFSKGIEIIQEDVYVWKIEMKKKKVNLN